MEELKKHGYGILIDSYGKKYEGEFDFDTPMGMGKIIYSDGSYYLGNTQKMQRQGSGKMVWPQTGDYFEGQFDKDLKEGVGYLYSKGKIYCGQYRQDQEEGVGEYLTTKVTEVKFDIDFKKIAMILDQIYKQCRSLGIEYECTQASVKF